MVGLANGAFDRWRRRLTLEANIFRLERMES